jgi:hypothetical protein
MLGYAKEDLDNMIDAVATAITETDLATKPWLHGSLSQTQSFLEGLWAEGYFD